MRSVVRWAINNAPAMNTLLVALLLLGLVSVLSMRREVFPEFELEIIFVNVPYPGASPEETEEGICQKIEEAVRAIDGIKKQTSIAQEGLGAVVLELETGTDPQKVLDEVRSEVDRIPSFPKDAEDPEVRQVTLRQPAIEVGVIGPESRHPQAERKLREVAERVREDLIRIDGISQADIAGAKKFQIDVEIPEDTLRKYGLTLQRVADVIRRENRDMPAGTIKTAGQSIRVKGAGKGEEGARIAEIPLAYQENGVVLTVGDLGHVRDEFEDTTSITRIDGRPGMFITVSRTAKEDILQISDAVQKYVAEKGPGMPPGYSLAYWGDRSVEVRDRMDLLVRNGWQGLLLVLVTLTLFLNTRLAFWVAMGIPVSILGACILLLFAGQTLNMLTMFAFLMALGIVVDDAIVVGENVYAHRQLGKGFFRAALDGTVEVFPSVLSSVATTVVAFLPLFFVVGVMGKFIACMPLAMIAMLVISLLESMTMLPCHLAHGGEAHGGTSKAGRLLTRLRHGVPYWGRLALAAAGVALVFLPVNYGPAAGLSLGVRLTLGVAGFLGVLVLFNVHQPLLLGRRALDWLNAGSNRGLDAAAERFYLPVLGWSLKNPGVVLSVAFVILILPVAMVKGGMVPFVIFPKMDANTIEASVTFPDGTDEEVTLAAIRRVEEAVRLVDAEVRAEAEARGEPVAHPMIRLTRYSVGFASRQDAPGKLSESSGSHLGMVTVELRDVTERPVSSLEILDRWRNHPHLEGRLAGAESVKFESAFKGPGGTPIEFRLLADADHFGELQQAVEKCKDKLRTYAGVFDVDDDYNVGKPELQFKVKEKARSLGINQEDLDTAIQASFQGVEVMRVQRGRHEVKIKVRYPPEERKSLANFANVRIRKGDVEYRLDEVADRVWERSPSEINRIDQLRAVKVSADVNEQVGNASDVVADLRTNFMPGLLKEFPAVSVRWEGQQQQTVESVQSMLVGYVVALLAMFVLLTLEFRSYSQPLLIMAIIPFGLVGAVLGHYAMGLPFTMFSLFGLVALTGVVVNDSIVLIDFINHRVREEKMPVDAALLDAGRRRLRPIFLTSITTVAGLLPLLLETSVQAQVLIPMAVSLCFGLTMTTVLVLFLMPTFYRIYASLALPQAALTGTAPAGEAGLETPEDRWAEEEAGPVPSGAGRNGAGPETLHGAPADGSFHVAAGGNGHPAPGNGRNGHAAGHEPQAEPSEAEHTH